MKILIISDLHGTKYYEKLKDALENIDYDCICLLGDNLTYDMDIIERFKKDVKVIGILGNHDTKYFYKQSYSFVENVHNKIINYNGITFGGIEGSLKYKNVPNYAMYEYDEYVDFINNLPKCDILLTHAGIDNPTDNFETYHHFLPLESYFLDKKPKINLFGHYHSNKAFMLDNVFCLCTFGCSWIDTEKKLYNVIFSE